MIKSRYQREVKAKKNCFSSLLCSLMVHQMFVPLFFMVLKMKAQVQAERCNIKTCWMNNIWVWWGIEARRAEAEGEKRRKRGGQGGFCDSVPDICSVFHLPPRHHGAGSNTATWSKTDTAGKNCLHFPLYANPDRTWATCKIYTSSEKETKCSEDGKWT